MMNGANMMMGQCQRYSEYEISPNHCTGGSAATGASERAARGIPAQITAAVPSTGTSAIAPGKSSWSVKVSAAAAITARPSQVATARVRRSRSPTITGASASSPPTPNSQARESVEK